MTRITRTTSSRRQRGQAMTEFVVGSVLFLLPLFLIVPMLGKYSDVKAASAQTARYVAWERTVWYGGSGSSVNWDSNAKSEGEIQNEARRRVVEFGKTLSKDDKSATAFANDGARGLWRNRDSSKMLPSYSDADVGAITNKAAPDTPTGVAVKAITDITGFLGFAPETSGYYTGNSAISITTLPIGASLGGTAAGGSFDPGTLVFRDKNVILANGWATNGAGRLKKQIAGLAPFGLVGDTTLGPLLQVVGCVALVAFAPEACWLEIGKIEPDVVPPDRLTN